MTPGRPLSPARYAVADPFEASVDVPLVGTATGDTNGGAAAAAFRRPPRRVVGADVAPGPRREVRFTGAAGGATGAAAAAALRRPPRRVVGAAVAFVAGAAARPRREVVLPGAAAAARVRLPLVGLAAASATAVVRRRVAGAVDAAAARFLAGVALADAAVRLVRVVVAAFFTVAAVVRGRRVAAAVGVRPDVARRAAPAVAPRRAAVRAATGFPALRAAALTFAAASWALSFSTFAASRSLRRRSCAISFATAVICRSRAASAPPRGLRCATFGAAPPPRAALFLGVAVVRRVLVRAMDQCPPHAPRGACRRGLEHTAPYTVLRRPALFHCGAYAHTPPPHHGEAPRLTTEWDRRCAWRSSAKPRSPTAPIGW